MRYATLAAVSFFWIGACGSTDGRVSTVTQAAPSGGTAGTSATSSSAGQAVTGSSVFCDLDGNTAGYASPASGSLLGPNIDVSLQPGDAVAYLEHTPGSYAVAAGYWLSLSGTTRTPANPTRIRIPADATSGMLTVFVEIPAPSPGTYTSTALSRCSSVGYSVSLPIPTSVDCSTATTCPAGCQLTGAMTAPRCEPTTPELGFFARGAMGCAGEPSTALGSWSLKLTSVSPCSDNPSSVNEITYFVVHGSLTANLIGDNEIAPTTGADTATLTMNF
jgi:hypothetical protein